MEKDIIDYIIEENHYNAKYNYNKKSRD